MRVKGKVIKWNIDKGFGFVALNISAEQVFIHKTDLYNKSRTPKINDVITFSITTDKQGRRRACDATFTGEKQPKKIATKPRLISVYIAMSFLLAICILYGIGKFPEKLILAYLGLSALTFLAYAVDKAKAKRGSWRTKESTLHMLSLLGGWPGAAFAQHLLRHKSAKKEFKRAFWFTVVVNVSSLMWLLFSDAGIKGSVSILAIFN